MQRSLVLAVALAGLASPLCTAKVRAPTTEEIARVFRSPRADQIALAPDGRHLAYTVRESRWLNLVIVDLHAPGQRTTLPIGEDVVMPSGGREIVVAHQLTYLNWPTSDRLVYAVAVPGEDVKAWAVDPDGGKAKLLADPKLVEQIEWPNELEYDARSGGPEPAPTRIRRWARVIGSCLDDPGHLFIEAVGGAGAAAELFRVDVRTGEFRSVNQEERPGRVFYDRQGRPRFRESVFTQRSEGAATSRALAAGMRGPLKALSRIELRGAPEWLDLSPTVYDYAAPGKQAAWKDFARGLGAVTGTTFNRTLEDYDRPAAVPLAFDRDPNLLYFATAGAQGTYGIYALDLTTGRRAAFALDDPPYDWITSVEAFTPGPLVFDRAGRLMGVRRPGPEGGTRWFDPGLAQLQSAMDNEFRGRAVTILDWTDARDCLLVLVSGFADPGRYFIYRPRQVDAWQELIQRAPWLPASTRLETTWFEFPSSTGGALRGTLTLPRGSRTKRAPLILFNHDLPGGSLRPELNRETYALASMGFAVAEVHYRGTTGLGAASRDAVRAAFDRGPIEDLREAVRQLAKNERINTRYVALVGRGYGGYLSARAVQLFPQDYRCAVLIDVPAELESLVGRLFPAHEPLLEPKLVRRAFFGLEAAPLRKISLAETPEPFLRAVLIVEDRANHMLKENDGSQLRRALSRRGAEVEYLAAPLGFGVREPNACARVFRHIGEFLNEHVYDYRVELGEAREVP